MLWAFTALVMRNDVIEYGCTAMAEKLEKVEKDYFKQLKLVVFGATGATGTEVVKQGLELGHEITAIVRTPDNIAIRSDNAGPIPLFYKDYNLYKFTQGTREDGS